MPDARPILVTGGTGQLASALASAPGTLRVGRPVFDFGHPDTIAETIRAAAPRLVVNAAAYTAVDAAETNADAAYQANCDGPGILARLCAAADIPLIHISTDYVFDGTKSTPYQESDPVGPQGVYGASKLAGEQAVFGAGGKPIILRTAWVYAPTGKNFVRTMLTVGKTRDRLTVVGDQFGCQTAASDLAAAIRPTPASSTPPEPVRPPGTASPPRHSRKPRDMAPKPRMWSRSPHATGRRR
jgi:dTDP-4-dehydrorhamnose reductase